MKMRDKVLGIALASLIGGMAIQSAHADTAEATCEVRKDGDTKRGKSGPCTFSQRQGFIDIDLKNGETLSLSPGNGAEQYRDQRGNKVHRVSAGSHSQEFKWEGGKHVVVTFLGSHHGNNHNDNPEHQGGHGGYRIEEIGNGNFEILWKSGCIADYDVRGRSTGYTQCNDEMKRRSDEVARERSR